MVGIDLGCPIAAEVPDEDPIGRGGGGQPLPIGRHRQRRGVRQLGRDRPGDLPVDGIAEGQPSVRLSDREESPIGRGRHEAEPRDLIAQLAAARCRRPGPRPGWSVRHVRVPGHHGQQSAAVQERHHADFVGEDAHRPRSELARGHVPEQKLLVAGRRGLGLSAGGEHGPVGREGEPLGDSPVSRQDGPGACGADDFQRMMPPAASHDARVWPSGDRSMQRTGASWCPSSATSRRLNRQRYHQAKSRCLGPGP